MTVVAGIDVGNSTTEVVVGRIRSGRVEVVGADRAPTRGRKGSGASLDAAVALVRRLERRLDVRVELAAAAPLRPVDTMTATLPEESAATGRLRVVHAGSSTAGGSGAGVGRPVVVGIGALQVPDNAKVTAVVPAGVGFSSALPSLRELAGRGQLAAVVLEADEGVLVANRLGSDVPVVDEVPTAELTSAQLVAVETRRGGPLKRLTDPLWLVAAFGLGDEEREAAAKASARLLDVANAVLALDAESRGPQVADAGWIQLRGARTPAPVPFSTGHSVVRAGTVGRATAYGLPPDGAGREVDDLFTVDLAQVADSVLARVGSLASRAITLAALHADSPVTDPTNALWQRLGASVLLTASEAGAARAGALTTPGAESSAVVVDVGGGTIDVIAESGEVVAAGAGELLTVSVAALAGSTRAAAEWVKRGPAARVESPQLLLGEDGARGFLDRPAPREAIGSLVVRGPGGLLPFDRRHGPGEWRALRLRLKSEVLGANLARALRTLGDEPRTVVVVGGAAGDDEVLGALARVLPDGVAVGRGDSGGELGHRYAVAYGLLLAAVAP